jgi:hypothetical protein
MRSPKWISPLFVLAALYDGVLGLLFLATPLYAFQVCDVTPPNHIGYVQFPASLLLIFSLIFVQVARDPFGNRSLILYGILLKTAYCSVAASHWIVTDIPWMWKPFVWIDLVMGMLFVWAYLVLRPRVETTPTRALD